MKLKKILIENIRSYEKEEIDFPIGSVLLWGDIGSGKTSILLAIEFALFGLQPGQKGSSLLRNGKDEGKVILEFEISDKAIIIERTLKKSKAISQDYCSISIDGEIQEISVTELKNKVLELLNYPKEFSKKQNLLYKFTVYTPQEQMKQIILQDATSRLNTLRHVFGIDKYKKILENISIVISQIREQKKLKEGMTFNLNIDKKDLELKQKEIEIKKQGILILQGELILNTEQRKRIELEKEQISLKIDEKNRFKQELEKTKLLISTKEQVLADNKRLVNELEQQIQEFSSLKFETQKVNELELKLSFLNSQIQEVNEKNLVVNSKIHSLTEKNQEIEHTKINISKLEMCPTCLQDVGPVYKSNVINKIESDISNNVNQIKSLILEKQEISKNIFSLEQEKNLIQKQINEMNILKVKLQGVQEKKIRKENLDKQIILINNDISILNQQFSLLKDSLFEFSKFDNIFDLKQEELKKAFEKEKISEIKLAELKKEISVFNLHINELSTRIVQAEKLKSELVYLNELEDWISKKFTPVISYIEKNVMVKLRAEFSQFFSQWFSMLVSDNFNVRLADDFTPIIEQQDYELDYEYLSGGERTAIALAYRLSLNQVINSLLSKIETKDLVILDEPTDGFSEQQLDKMRDVLQQLDVAQLIIVSHEQKIEGFVEKVIKLRKESGISSKE